MFLKALSHIEDNHHLIASTTSSLEPSTHRLEDGECADSNENSPSSWQLARRCSSVGAVQCSVLVFLYFRKESTSTEYVATSSFAKGKQTTHADSRYAAMLLKNVRAHF